MTVSFADRVLEVEHPLAKEDITMIASDRQLLGEATRVVLTTGFKKAGYKTLEEARLAIGAGTGLIALGGILVTVAGHFITEIPHSGWAKRRALKEGEEKQLVQEGKMAPRPGIFRWRRAAGGQRAALPSRGETKTEGPSAPAGGAPAPA